MMVKYFVYSVYFRHPAMHMYGSVHTDRHVRVYLLCMGAQQRLVPLVYLYIYMRA